MSSHSLRVLEGTHMLSSSATDRVLALVLAGGQGGRLRPLTTRRAKPALPFAGVYRLIDFALSHLVHSRVRDVWVVEQFESHSINDHLLNGRPWDLDRNRGGLRVFAPHVKGDSDDDGFHQGNADAIWRNARYIREFAPELLVVMSADHIYQLDVRPVLEAHRDTGAAVTMVTTQVPVETAGRYGTLKTDSNGRVTFWDYKPDEPQTGTVTTEVFIYTTDILLDVLEHLANQAKQDGEDGKGEGTLKDFGHELLPELVQQGNAWAWPMNGYWRDVGTLQSYWEGHMDLLRPDSPLQLDDPNWPILTTGTMRVPARVRGGAQVENSLLSPGCIVEGTVINSVLCPGTVVEAGAVVRDSIVLENARVQSGAAVSRAIVDEGMLAQGNHDGQDDVIVVSREET
ncbi:MAG TPA: glucose-1-phosphate adenylyltransferase family protein [Abditibacteriaceae bacterium]